MINYYTDQFNSSESTDAKSYFNFKIVQRDICQRAELFLELMRPSGMQRNQIIYTVSRKLSRFGHVCRHDTLPNSIPQGTADGSRRTGRPRKSRKNNNIEAWTGQSLSLILIADDRSQCATITTEASVGVHQIRLSVTGFS